jgi:hypothetical protein
MRQAFAYGGAAAMTPYLLIKISWVIAGISGLAAGGLGFVLLNLVTVAMSATGIALALALARPWGLRLPARPVLAFAWLAGGFLVPMVPYMIVSSLLPAHGPASAAPAWEQWLIEASFLGLGVCLAVALPSYLRERWPAAFAPSARPRSARPAALLAAGFAAVSAYWALGGRAGIAHPEARAAGDQLLLANDALWALATAAGAWFLGRGAVAAALTWVGSGFLFAWNAWKLPLGLLLGDRTGWPESPAAAAARFALGIAAGALMLLSIRAMHGLRSASPGDRSSRETPFGPGGPLFGVRGVKSG